MLCFILIKILWLESRNNSDNSTLYVAPFFFLSISCGICGIFVFLFHKHHLSIIQRVLTHYVIKLGWISEILGIFF